MQVGARVQVSKHRLRSRRAFFGRARTRNKVSIPAKKADRVSSIRPGRGSSRSHFSTPASSTSFARGSMRSSQRVNNSRSRRSSTRYTGNLACSDEQPAMKALHSVQSNAKSTASTTRIASQSGQATWTPAGYTDARSAATAPGASPGCTRAQSSSSTSPSSLACRCLRRALRWRRGSLLIRIGVVRSCTTGESRYIRKMEKTNGLRMFCR